jgi:hypothetical protein
MRRDLCELPTAAHDVAPPAAGDVMRTHALQKGWRFVGGAVVMLVVVVCLCECVCVCVGGGGGGGGM